MAEMEKQASVGSAMQEAEKAAEIGLRVAAPYPQIIKWLIIGFTTLLIICNLVWGGVFWYQIKRAYDDPVEIGIEQSQDFTGQTQEQTGKGVN